MRTLALFLTLTFAFSSPSFAQVKVDQGGTGTTANTGASGRILVGQGNSTFLEKAMSGDCTLAASGAISCTASGSSITFDIGDDGGNDSTAVNEIATSGDTNSIASMPSANKILFNMSLDWPKCDEADALDANGSNCSAGSYARGVDTAGAAENCTADDDSPDNDGEVPNGITVDLSASGIVSGGTANKCAEFDASGFLTSSADACGSGGGVTGPGSSNDNGIARFDGTDGAVIQDSPGCTIDDSGNLVCTSVEGDCTPASNNCGMTTDDNSADHAAPGAGLTTWYSVSGRPRVRAGASGSAMRVTASSATARMIEMMGGLAWNSSADAHPFTDDQCACILKQIGAYTMLDVDDVTVRSDVQGVNEVVEFAIYSSDGATQYMECGMDESQSAGNTADCSTGNDIASPAAMEPGEYWFCWASDDGGDATMSVRFDSSTAGPAPYARFTQTCASGEAPATLTTPAITWTDTKPPAFILYDR